MKSDDQDAPLQKVRRSAKPRKADVTRRAILITTARMFAEKGYSECNLREIAEEVGIKAGSFYYHFRSKDQILDEILDASITLMSGAVNSAVAELGPDAPALAKIAVAMRAHVATFLVDDASSAALMRVYEHLPPSMKRRSREQRRAYAQIWFDLFEQGVKPRRGMVQSTPYARFGSVRAGGRAVLERRGDRQGREGEDPGGLIENRRCNQTNVC